MRLGGPVFEDCDTPRQWVEALRRLSYRAALCPVDEHADDATVADYAAAAEDADIVIAEIGAWSNTLSADEAERREAIDYCTRRLALADRIGARCCVNVAGSRGERKNHPHPDNFSPATFELLVETVREIIDAAAPTRTYYTVEMMPCAPPDSPEAYAELLRAVDRERFAVHLDPVNIVSSPRRYFASGELIRQCVRLLGPHVRSCHAKDVLLRPGALVHLDEVRPGLGGLDYAAYLRAVEALDPEMPLLLEHLPGSEQYQAAAEHVRSVARRVGVGL
jgi:sugar phosphate isomerase/epimerase